jgi:hypothetical protein
MMHARHGARLTLGTPTIYRIRVQSGRVGGWSLYVQEGTPIFLYNYLGINRYITTASTKLPKGKSTVKMDFACDGGKPGSGGTATLYIGGEAVESCREHRGAHRDPSLALTRQPSLRAARGL